MKFSTLIMVCGLVFTQQAFAQNNGKNTSDCHSQNANNNKACTATNNTTNNKNNVNQQGSKSVVQTTTKTTVTTEQKVSNGSKAATQASKTTAYSSKTAVNTPQKVQQKSVTTTHKTTTKAVSGRSLVLQTQQQLNRLGYKAGSADGLMGKNTRTAIKRFQKKHNLHIDGKSTSALLTILKKANH
ncbi:peptidoglycan-binding domain-containing protein [Psychromonas sp. KJ10-2]|uniref:peptidoglycan-binding domain-containing protein n=1 Tax=Psychromonas sp. KJ10-2 TaxID=3391822 RepID=UPI0039B3F59F